MSRYRLPRLITERWIEALESGNYKQGIGYLFQEQYDTYCSLGVLGEVCGIERDKMEEVACLYSDVVNEEVPKELIVLKNEDTTLLSKYGLHQNLAELNDSGRYNFKEIASWIKENVELYD